MGKRGPPPMPPHLRLLRGDARPSRAKPPIEATIAPELPPPPAFLTGYALEQWHAVAPELYRLQLLTVLDVQPLAAWAVAAGRWRSASEALAQLPESERLVVGDRPQPLLKVISDSADRMMKLGAMFGLTPASRARLAGHGKKPRVNSAATLASLPEKNPPRGEHRGKSSSKGLTASTLCRRAADSQPSTRPPCRSL